MRRFLTIASLAAAAAVAAPLAVAGNGKPAARAVCKPVSLAGKVASVATGSFALDLLRAGRTGRVTVGVPAQTRVQIGPRRAALADLSAGQPVLVVGRACASVVTARLVVAKVDPTKVPITTGDSGLDGGAATPAPAPAAAPATPSAPDETSLDG